MQVMNELKTIHSRKVYLPNSGLWSHGFAVLIHTDLVHVQKAERNKYPFERLQFWTAQKPGEQVDYRAGRAMQLI